MLKPTSHRRIVSILLLPSVLAAICFAHRAEGTKAPPTPAPKPGALTLTMERVVVFKDGYGLFVKSGEGTTDREGHLVTTEVPSAVLGTFWASVDDHDLLSMTSAWAESVDEKTEDVDCPSTIAILRANPGKTVSIHTEKSDVTGRIVKVLETSTPTVNVVPRSATSAFIPPAPAAVPLLVLDNTPAGRLIMSAGDVLSVSGSDLGTECKQHRQESRKTKQLTLDLGRAAAEKQVKVHFFYFAPGVRWIPTYRVETGKGSKAAIELQAEILNEAEDLKNVAVDLVVGVPNFRFKDTASPLSLESTLRQTLSQAAPGLMSQSLRMGNNMSNAVQLPVSNENDEPAPPSAPSVMSLAPNLTGEGRQDLFTYAAKSLTLPKGGRAVVPLWKSHASQRHLYTADLSIVRSQNAYAHAADGTTSPLKLEANTVWHQLELKDDSDVPWTTGAVLLTEGYLPLAQELLTYTSAGAKAQIPITIAVDLKARLEEKETSRTPNALTLGDRHYTRIQKKGTVTLTSHRKERSFMRLSLSMGGKVESASNDGDIVIDEARPADWGSGMDPRAANHSAVNWEVSVGPGETRTLTYSVTFFE